MGRTRVLVTTVGVSETCKGAVEESMEAEEKLQRKEDRGGKGGMEKGGSNGKEKRGIAGRMTGWERHSIHSSPGLKVRKVRVQTLGMGGQTFMLTKVCVSKERQ